MRSSVQSEGTSRATGSLPSHPEHCGRPGQHLSWQDCSLHQHSSAKALQGIQVSRGSAISVLDTSRLGQIAEDWHQVVSSAFTKLDVPPKTSSVYVQHMYTRVASATPDIPMPPW